MNDMIEFLTSKEIIVVYIVVAVACLLCFIIYLIDKNNAKRKRKNNTRKLNKLVDDVNLRMQEGLDNDLPKKKVLKVNDEHPPVKQEEKKPSPVVANAKRIDLPVEEVITNTKRQESSMTTPPVVSPRTIDDYMMQSASSYKEVPSRERHKEVPSEDISKMMDAQINSVNEKIEELIYTDPEPNREEATRELIELTEKLEKAERAQRENKIDITAYEASQEENAIISIDELQRKSKEMYAANELTQYAEEKEEPITLNDLERRKSSSTYQSTNDMYDTVREKVQVVEDRKPTSNGYSGSKSYHQPVISPIYGIDRHEEEYDENARYDIDEDELAKTSEFLLSLKDLQSRL